MNKINIQDYSYPLPPERIANFPLSVRDQSKLLHYRDGQIEHYVFQQIYQLLPPHFQLVFNNTKVLPARIFFEKETGSTIEVFLLHPVLPTPVVAEAMLAKGEAVWECTIGNLKRWKEGTVLSRALMIGQERTVLKAIVYNREKQYVMLSWDNPALNFVDVVQAAGVTPLPPYLKRKATDRDKETYQTVYSKKEGAVAAPTAGLHFTERVLDNLRQQGNQLLEVTLHVSAGTFQPVKAENAVEHTMHQEQVIINRQTLAELVSDRPVCVVGTTSMRTLESLYWYGVKLIKQDQEASFFIEKLFPYQFDHQALPTKKESFSAILEKMDREGAQELLGETEIYIFPGYRFQVCEAIITNFHQPESTLMLLVAAFVGEDWKRIYQTALDNDYRFLSYGDSSLLWRR